MTAILGSDYGLITLTPSQEVDFTSGASTTYSVSTLRTAESGPINNGTGGSLPDFAVWDMSLFPACLLYGGLASGQ